MQSAETFVRKPDGGFRFITAEQLFMAWWCYRVNQIRLFDLRIWFALHEIVSRRCQQNKKSTSNYEIDEVGDLIACTDLTAIRAGLRRLATCGLAVCTTRQITFAKHGSELNGYDAAEFTDAFLQIPNRKRRVPVPRRIIRMISAGARKTLVATTIGHLLRLAYYRKGQCRLDGSCKSSWIATVFGIDVRSAKAARKRLVHIGWLKSSDMPQWYLNRYGWRGVVNPEWDAPCVAKRSPQMKPNRVKRSPLRENKKLSSRTCTNQKLARRDPNGVRKKRWLTNVDSDDLATHTGRRKLFHRAVKAGIVSNDGASYRYFQAAAVRSRRLATRNAAGMFAWLVSNRYWGHLADVDFKTNTRPRKQAAVVPPEHRVFDRSRGFLLPEASPPPQDLQIVQEILTSLRCDRSSGTRTGRPVADSASRNAAVCHYL